MKKPANKSSDGSASQRKSRGRLREDVLFPVAPVASELPRSYAVVLGEIRKLIRTERLRVVNCRQCGHGPPVLDIGRLIWNVRERRVGVPRSSIGFRGPPRGISGYARAFFTQSQVHAGFCLCLAATGICARGSCTNSLVSPHSPP